jgi:hypothetical protein
MKTSNPLGKRYNRKTHFKVNEKLYLNITPRIMLILNNYNDKNIQISLIQKIITDVIIDCNKDEELIRKDEREQALKDFVERCKKQITIVPLYNSKGELRSKELEIKLGQIAKQLGAKDEK